MGLLYSGIFILKSSIYYNIMSIRTVLFRSLIMTSQQYDICTSKGKISIVFSHVIVQGEGSIAVDGRSIEDWINNRFIGLVEMSEFVSHFFVSLG